MSINNGVAYIWWNVFLFELNLIFVIIYFTNIYNYRYKGSPRKVATPGDGIILSSGSYDRLTMDGKEVYKFATREVPVVITEALDAAGLTVDDVDWLLLHQVRSFIILSFYLMLNSKKEIEITHVILFQNSFYAF